MAPEPLRSIRLMLHYWLLTYEKYLGLLAANGIKRDMSHVLIVYDEIQILGDESRGRNIEVLMTLLKNSSLGQLIALSAVIDSRDAQNLADWLDLKLVHNSRREKHLVYECRFPAQVARFKTEYAESIDRVAECLPQDTTEIVASLCKDKKNLPVVVFCMTVPRVHDCVENFIQHTGIVPDHTLPLFSGLYEETVSARQLTGLLEHRVAFHTADLLDEERKLVEEKLRNNEIDVIFSTTTLAAGVNFPFTTAVFDDWLRYDFKTKSRFPISNSEFQNMAGRAGRMGFSSDFGKVIFCSDDSYAARKAVESYLNPDAISPFRSQMSSSAFEQIALWLLSCEMCNSAESIKDFLLGTFNAFIEKTSNISGLAHWQTKPQEVIEKLRGWGFIL